MARAWSLVAVMGVLACGPGPRPPAGYAPPGRQQDPDPVDEERPARVDRFSASADDEPVRAHVFVNGVRRGLTPLEVEATYPVTLFAPGFRPEHVVAETVDGHELDRDVRLVRSRAARPPVPVTSHQREVAWRLVLEAITAAHDGNCDRVRELDAQVAAADPKVAEVVRTELTLVTCGATP